MEISKVKIAKELNINLKTFYNWEKNKPKLYNFIINCYKQKKDNVNITKEEMELLESFRKLDKKEKELYYHEIKAKALRKELNKG